MNPVLSRGWMGGSVWIGAFDNLSPHPVFAWELIDFSHADERQWSGGKKDGERCLSPSSV
jgi:hypothetical protein